MQSDLEQFRGTPSIEAFALQNHTSC